MEAPYSSDHPYDLPVPGSTNIKLIINDHIQSPVINSLFFHHLLYNNIVRKKFTLFPASRKRSVYIFPDLISGVEENRYVGEYLCMMALLTVIELAANRSANSFVSFSLHAAI